MSAPMDGAVAAAAAIAAGQVSPVELTQAYLHRIEALDAASARGSTSTPSARSAEAAAAQPGPLHGVPFGVKDVFNTQYLPTTMGSEVWAGFTPGNDARAVFNARRAGGAVLGKTVTAEFGVHEPGRTRNPHDLSKSTGHLLQRLGRGGRRRHGPVGARHADRGLDRAPGVLLRRLRLQALLRRDPAHGHPEDDGHAGHRRRPQPPPRGPAGAAGGAARARLQLPLDRSFA